MEREMYATTEILVNIPLELVDRWPLGTNSSQNSLTSSVVVVSSQNSTQLRCGSGESDLNCHNCQLEF